MSDDKPREFWILKPKPETFLQDQLLASTGTDAQNEHLFETKTHVIEYSAVQWFKDQFETAAHKVNNLSVENKKQAALIETLLKENEELKEYKWKYEDLCK